MKSETYPSKLRDIFKSGSQFIAVHRPIVRAVITKMVWGKNPDDEDKVYYRILDGEYAGNYSMYLGDFMYEFKPSK